MIQAIAVRRLSLNGESYSKGDHVPMTLQQFNDLEPTGLVKRGAARRRSSSQASPEQGVTLTSVPEGHASSVRHDPANDPTA